MSENTHYGVIMFSGDIDNDHPDDNFRGHGPEMQLIACGPEAFCWERLDQWTSTHPFARDCTAEVVKRDLPVRSRLWTRLPSRESAPARYVVLYLCAPVRPRRRPPMQLQRILAPGRRKGRWGMSDPYNYGVVIRHSDPMPDSPGYWRWQIDLETGNGVLDFGYAPSRRKAVRKITRSIRRHSRRVRKEQADYWWTDTYPAPPVAPEGEVNTPNVEN